MRTLGRCERMILAVQVGINLVLTRLADDIRILPGTVFVAKDFPFNEVFGMLLIEMTALVNNPCTDDPFNNLILFKLFALTFSFNVHGFNVFSGGI
jgi:hypothetical protein